MSIDIYLEAAKAILHERGLETTFRHGQDIAFFRCETLSDRRLEVSLRPNRWSIDYVHVPTKRTMRVKGEDVAALGRSLTPLCQDVAFEPIEGAANVTQAVTRK